MEQLIWRFIWSHDKNDRKHVRMKQISDEDLKYLKNGCESIMNIAMKYASPYVSDVEDWHSVHSNADLMLRVLEEVEWLGLVKGTSL